MLLFVTGASGSGKTVVIPGLKKKFTEFSIHDFDERDAPAIGDNRGRQEQTAYWINRAIENQLLGKDTIICGGAVYGEILACPSIHQIDHLAVCLLDCADIVRIDRLQRHGQHQPDMALLSWAAWLRVHAVDPTWCPDVIMRDSYASMHWDNWLGWQRGDPRWQQVIIDTGGKKIGQITTEVARWIETQINRKDMNELPSMPGDADLI